MLRARICLCLRLRLSLSICLRTRMQRRLRIGHRIRHILPNCIRISIDIRICWVSEVIVSSSTRDNASTMRSLKQIFNLPNGRHGRNVNRRVDVTVQILDKTSIQILERTSKTEFFVVDAEGKWWIS